MTGNTRRVKDDRHSPPETDHLFDTLTIVLSSLGRLNASWYELSDDEKRSLSSKAETTMHSAVAEIKQLLQIPDLSDLPFVTNL